MATNIIENFTIFEIFWLFLGGQNKFFSLDFLQIGNIFVNKKGANYELMAKFKFLLNSNGYFSKKWQKSASNFSRVFFKPNYWTEIRENQ